MVCPGEGKGTGWNPYGVGEEGVKKVWQVVDGIIIMWAVKMAVLWTPVNLEYASSLYGVAAMILVVVIYDGGKK